MVATAATALYSRRVSTSLIMLFYSSLTLGIIFTLYGSVLVGLLHIITFAGAVSVLLLTAVLLTGESDLRLGASTSRAALTGGILVVIASASAFLFGAIPAGSAAQEPNPESVLEFLWLYRPWDLLILLMVLASSMVVIVNLFSKEAE